MLLHVDHLQHQGIMGFASTPDKIEANFKLLPTFEEGANQQRKKATDAFVAINIFGRWVVVYREQIQRPAENIMYFFDFRYDVESVVVAMFSPPLAQAILSLQAKFDQQYQEYNNTVELTLAALYEVTIGQNMFACNNDEQVIKKADLLGVLPILQAQNTEQSTKACFADEVENDGESTIKNLYAIFRFQGQTRRGDLDEGYVYLKLRDLEKNTSLLNEFLDKVLDSGVSFDRMSTLQRFTKDRLN